MKMIQYTGTKTIKACPMTLGEAEKVLNRHIDTSAVEDRSSQPGYLVEYGEDGDGYRSWSPKEVFEKAYRVSETYVDRMMIERDEVKERYLNGRKFMFSDKFNTLSDNDKTMLGSQLNAMERYLMILSERIGVAQEKEKAEKMEMKCVSR